MPLGDRVYVTNEILDVTKHRVIGRIQLAGPLTRPMGVISSPDGKHVFVSSGRGKTVTIIDTTTNSAIGAVEVGERPWGLDVSPDGGTLVTANGPSNDVSFVDVATRTIVAKVKAGDRPWGVVWVAPQAP